jgi:WD repeat-containing protein 24
MVSSRRPWRICSFPNLECVVRDVGHASELKSRQKYSGQADGIRDVKWSPTEGVDFAFGTDSGWIQRWDMRNLKTAKIKIYAHSTTCNAIDWHPDGKHIASASADKTVRVWDVSVNRRQRAAWEVKTPYPISNARWRPSCEASAHYDSGLRQCTQLVAAYVGHPVLHIWDLRRPALAFRELSPYPTAVTDLLWHSQDLLWTVGREGLFLQTDIQYVTKTISKRNLQAIGVSSRGEINILTQRRRFRRSAQGSRPIAGLQHQSSIVSQISERGVLSRSWVDDGIDQSFLSSSSPKKKLPTRMKSRAQSLNMAMPVKDVHLSTNASLDEVLSSRSSFRPQQAACRGLLDTRSHSQAFEVLARHLQFELGTVLQQIDALAALQEMLDANAECYEAVGMYRLAQTLRIVNAIVSHHLEERRRTKETSITGEIKPALGHNEHRSLSQIAKEYMNFQLVSASPSPVKPRPLSSIAQQLANSDKASDQLTPQARPLTSKQMPQQPAEDVEQLALPPLFVPMADQSSLEVNGSKDSQLTKTNLDGLQQQQHLGHDDKSEQVRRWSIQPKEPLNLDPVDPVWIEPRLQKHDSNESFTFLAESLNSREASFPSSYNSQRSASGHLMVAERPSRGQRHNTRPLSGIQAVDFAAKKDVFLPLTEAQRFSTVNGDQPPDPIEQTLDISPDGVEMNIPQTNMDDVGPGSYPDENGIFALIEPSPSVKQGVVMETVRSPPGIPAAPAVEAPDPERSISRLSTENSAARMISKFQSPYLSEDDDPDIEEDEPFTLLDMLQELIADYSTKGNAQTATLLILIIGPLLPRTHRLPDAEIESTVHLYVDRLADAGFTEDEIFEILDAYFDPLVKSGLQPLQIEAVIETYHAQLLSYELFNEAGSLRKLSYPIYPAVYEDSLKDNFIHVRCGACHKPLVTGLSSLLCESCHARQMGCQICWSQSSPFAGEDPSLGSARLLTTCLLCNHSNHSFCLRVWFCDSGENDGGCPMPGCLCDCVAGSWRNEKVAISEKRRYARTHSHQRVKSDEWTVAMSKAVETTRTALGLTQQQKTNLTKEQKQSH